MVLRGLFFAVATLGVLVFTQECGKKGQGELMQIGQCCRREGLVNSLASKAEELLPSVRECAEGIYKQLHPDGAGKDPSKALNRKEAQCKYTECYLNAIEGMADGKIVKDKVLNFVNTTWADDQWGPAVAKSVEFCLDEKLENSQCTNGLDVFTQCTLAQIYANCPEEKYNKSDVCDEGQKYVRKCYAFIPQMLL